MRLISSLDSNRSGVWLFSKRLGDLNLEESTEAERFLDPSLLLPFVLSPASSLIFFSFESSCSLNFCCTWSWISFALLWSLCGVMSRDQDFLGFPDLLWLSSEDQPDPLRDLFLLVDGGGFLVSPSLNVVTNFGGFEVLFEFRFLSRDFDRDLPCFDRLRSLDELRLLE